MPTLTKLKKKPSDYKKNGKAADISKIYNTPQWKKLRLAYLMQHPLCEDCEKNGIVEPATEVHHVKPISTGTTDLEMKEIAYNPNNLRSLCSKCHHKVHLAMKHT